MHGRTAVRPCMHVRAQMGGRSHPPYEHPPHCYLLLLLLLLRLGGGCAAEGGREQQQERPHPTAARTGVQPALA